MLRLMPVCQYWGPENLDCPTAASPPRSSAVDFAMSPVYFLQPGLYRGRTHRLTVTALWTLWLMACTRIKNAHSHQLYLRCSMVGLWAEVWHHFPAPPSLPFHLPVGLSCSNFLARQFSKQKQKTFLLSFELYHTISIQRAKVKCKFVN